jgi:hypothetical protein
MQPGMQKCKKFLRNMFGNEHLLYVLYLVGKVLSGVETKGS